MDKNIESNEEPSREIKLTTDEKNEVIQLNADYQELLLELGQLYIRKLQVDEERDIIDTLETEHSNAYSELQSKERDFTIRLNRKYGDGNLDPAGGIYIKN